MLDGIDWEMWGETDLSEFWDDDLICHSYGRCRKVLRHDKTTAVQGQA
jgi:hypothetical protein